MADAPFALRLPVDDDGPAAVDRQVIQLFALVAEALAGATHALLAGDRDAARALTASDEAIDRLYHQVEAAAALRAERASSADELRYLVTVLRILPEIERSGDLAAHVASRAVRGLGVELSHRTRGMIEQMGEIACDMWRRTADAYADRDREAANGLESLDDDLDELHVLLTAEIASGSMPVPVAIEAALIARFYERLGDHAVNLARRIATLPPTTADPTGASPPHDPVRDRPTSTGTAG
jgi:phosphate transport system protein